MLKRVKIRNFKSLEAVDVELRGLNLFVGTNSSGKSNFLDALRLLQGIGNGFTISEILNGKPRTATSEVWEGMRGGAEFATFRPNNEVVAADVPITLEVTVQLKKQDLYEFTYHIEFSAKRGKVEAEWLSTPGHVIFDSTKVDSSWSAHTLSVSYSKRKRGPWPSSQFDRSRPVLHQFAEHFDPLPSERKLVTACIEALSDFQRLDPSPEELRKYSNAQQASRMGERGENFAALVSQILSKEQDKIAYVDWLQQLNPADVDDVTVLRGALQEPLFAVKEGGKEFPAQVLSDGTLRFAAIAAAFFQESMPSVLTLEEIEKGIHPRRLRLLVELLRSQTKRLGNQVIATTHSPEILDWLSREDLKSTFVSLRDIETGASTIKSVAGMTGLDEAIHSDATLSELFSEGWLESVA
jgi:predicted ATPase